MSISPRQVIVLIVAAIAAIGAMLLVRGNGAPRPDVSAAKAEQPVAGEQVLVVTANVAQGAQLKPSDLAWRVFPNASVTDSFIRSSQRPSAQADMTGGVARRAFLAGEPVTPGSIVMPNSRGFMAAMLSPGFRAVSVKIKTETAAGGYIQPNDHVDVVLTTTTQRTDSGGGSGRDVRSTVVLEDVRVLALGETTQTQATGDAPQQVTADVAVLELTPVDGDTLSQAVAMGDISLTLRGVQQDVAGAPGAAHPNDNRQGSILIHAFGNVSSGGGR